MRTWKSLVSLLGASAMVAGGASVASAATPTYSATSNVTVNGGQATATATIKSSTTVVAERAGVCARSASGAIVDFPKSDNVTVDADGTTISGTQFLQVGTYSYYVCIKVAGSWRNVGSTQNFAVATTQVAYPSAMPVGDLAGWDQVFTEDFKTAVPTGQFPGTVYGSKWGGYKDGWKDTWGKGIYAPSKVLSVHDGVLDMNLREENGVGLGAAPIPMLDGKWNGLKYGRYSVRFKSEPVTGFKAAWLMWPVSDNWNEGEINFPEGNLDGGIWAYNHCVGNPTQNCLAVNTRAVYTDWHVATLDWTPAGVTYYLDGQKVGTSTVSPSTAMRWVLQTETRSTGVPKGANGNLLVDWAVIYKKV